MVFQTQNNNDKETRKKEDRIRTNESKQHESNQNERIHQIITYKHKRQW